MRPGIITWSADETTGVVFHRKHSRRPLVRTSRRLHRVALSSLERRPEGRRTGGEGPGEPTRKEGRTFGPRSVGDG